jgi:hypothetical protein
MKLKPLLLAILLGASSGQPADCWKFSAPRKRRDRCLPPHATQAGQEKLPQG